MKKTVFLSLFLVVVTNTAVADDKTDQTILDEIVIVSSRSQTSLRQIGTSVSILKKEEIELKGYRSLSDTLRTQAGIAVSNSGGAGKQTAVRIRGEEGYRTLMLIDGVEISDPTGTQIGAQAQHLSSSGDIEKIEILRGPQGFIYGADAGGVVNILTRSVKEGMEAQVAADVGRYNSTNINSHIAAGSQTGDVFLSISNQSTDGFNTRTDDTTGEVDGYDNTTFHTKLGWNINSFLRAQLVARDVAAESKFDNCGFPSSNNCNADYDQTTLKASIESISTVINHHFGVSNTDIKRKNNTNNIETLNTKGSIEKLEYVGNYTVDSSLAYVFGADYKVESIDNSIAIENERNQLGIFSELQKNFDNAFFINAGVRYDDNEDFGKHTSIRLSSAYVHEMKNGSSLKYRSSFGTGFRAPSLAEIDYNTGASAFGDAAGLVPEEEQSRGFEMGLDYFNQAGLNMQFTYFHQKIENEIFFDLVNFSGYLQTQDVSRSEGLEFSFEYDVTDYFSLQANGTYNTTRQNDDAVRARRPKKIANVAANFSLLDNALNVLINLRIAKDSENEIFGIGRVALDDYTVLDVSTNYTFNKSFNVYARIENALDEDYEEVTGFNTSGTAIYSGVRISF